MYKRLPTARHEACKTFRSEERNVTDPAAGPGPRHDDDGRTVSPWMEAEPPRRLVPLEGDLVADVCVVGAGVAGVTTAYCAAREGMRVVLLDDGTLAGGQTKRTTAHLASAIDDRFVEIERVHGSAGARSAAASHASAIDWIERIVGEQGIDCDFERVDGHLCLAEGCSPRWLEHEYEAARRAGVAVDLLQKGPGIAGFEGPSLRFPGQGQIHPLRYLSGLLAGAERLGVRVACGHVDAVSSIGDDCVRATTRSGARVDARFAVMATNSPVHERVAIHTKQAPYRTYAIAARVPRGSVAKALYWDTLDPYHYVRTVAGGAASEFDLLLVGGEDRRVGPMSDEDATARYGALESWMRERFPQAQSVTHRWSGQVLETLDGLAFIGPTPSGPPNVLVVSGDSGMGMTHGTLAGPLLVDAMQGRENEWSRLYDPSRKPLATASTFLKENLDTGLGYVEWLRPGDGDPKQLRRDCGGIFGWGLHKRAIYRDLDGRLHTRSALCPHLGGIVGWNDAEKTWDCPCHGSRFDRYGRVVQGPANADLGPKP